MEGLTAEEAQVYDRQVRGGAPAEGPGRGRSRPLVGRPRGRGEGAD